MKDNDTSRKDVSSQSVNEKLSFSIVEPNVVSVPQLIESKISGKGYISYGEGNNFPNYLFGLYLKSSLLQSIINGINDYVMGDGIINIDPNIKADKINADGETLEDLIDKIDLDLQIFGGFAINILYDYEHRISELYWVDMRKVRIDKYETKAFIHDDFAWGSKPIEIDLYDKNKIEESWKTDNPINSCLFYYKGNVTRGIYPVPSYNGSLEAIETSIQINKFHLSNINNNLATSVVFSFTNGDPTEEEKAKLEKAIKEKLGGASNAGKFMMFFADDKEHSVEVTRLDEDNMDEKFKTLREDTLKNIFIAFRAQPELFGLQADGKGFSKEEYLQVFELYNKTMIQPIQKDIVRVFNKIYGVDKAFDFVQFSLSPVENISEE